jgi:hypothetical protein
MANVFVFYARQDEHIANRLSKMLKADGQTVITAIRVEAPADLDKVAQLVRRSVEHQTESPTGYRAARSAWIRIVASQHTGHLLIAIVSALAGAIIMWLVL